MKKRTLIILAVIVGIIVTIYLSFRSWIQKVQYGVDKGVKLKKISVRNIIVYLPIYFYNPSSLNIVVSNLDLKVFMDNYFVTNITSRGNYELRSKQYSTYPIDINIAPGDLLKILSEKGQVIDDPDWLKDVNVNVQGTATFDLGFIRIPNVPINFSDSLKYYVE
jgi:hypothetical protein